MPGLLAAWLAPFASLFIRPTWSRVSVLAEGALLTLHLSTAERIQARKAE
jgi:hypothetical protein